MPKHTPIAEVMTTRLCTADVGDTLETVRAMMVRESIHHVPILEGRKLAGIISSRDLVQTYRKARSDGDATTPEDATVASLMQRNVVTMRSDENVERALDLLAAGAIHSVLVLDADE
jgi:CBS domain-containing protein